MEFHVHIAYDAELDQFFAGFVNQELHPDSLEPAAEHNYTRVVRLDLGFMFHLYWIDIQPTRYEEAELMPHLVAKAQEEQYKYIDPAILLN